MEKDKWERAGCVKDASEIWVSNEGKLVLPDSMLPAMVCHLHGSTPAGRDVMVNTFKKYWYNPLCRVLVESFCQRCIVC